MIGAALTLLAIAAVGGITMVVIRLRGAPRPPTWLAALHGAFALAGLVCVIYEAATVTLPTLAIAALVILALAALGGGFVFAAFHLQSKPLPIPLILGHGLIALSGFICLAIHHFNQHQLGVRP